MGEFCKKESEVFAPDSPGPAPTGRPPYFPQPSFSHHAGSLIAIGFYGRERRDRADGGCTV